MAISVFDNNCGHIGKQSIENRVALIARHTKFDWAIIMRKVSSGPAKKIILFIILIPLPSIASASLTVEVFFAVKHI